MRQLLSAGVLLMAAVLPAQAENWTPVHKSLFIDTESMFRDSDGYTRFKTRELNSSGSVMHQHKEAVHCGRAKHYFRKMYSATAAVNNRNDSDVEADATWSNWRQNPREAYEPERQTAIKNFVCSRSAAPAKSTSTTKSPTPPAAPKSPTPPKQPQPSK
jgi:hypothetical protein